ncbi:MAG: LysR family transcriptional regulator [Granulosicoccus sp.]
MEMNQIRYFLAVCDHRNFTHAAQASNVSQPSLTTAIRKLEDEFGGPLFLRDRAGCRLTALGALVQPHLQKIQQETAQAKTVAIRHIRLERVPITVGVGETIGQGNIAEALERFRYRLPEAEIELIIDTHSALLEGLRDGKFDIVITAAEASSDIYRIDSLYHEGYRVVVAADHALSRHKAITLDLLANTHMLDRPNCEMRETLQATCTEKGHSLYAAYRSNRLDWLLELARVGSGALILPVTAIPDDKSLVSLPIEGMEIQRHVIALRHRHQPSRPEATELVRVLKS